MVYISLFLLDKKKRKKKAAPSIRVSMCVDEAKKEGKKQEKRFEKRSKNESENNESMKNKKFKCEKAVFYPCLVWCAVKVVLYAHHYFIFHMYQSFQKRFDKRKTNPVSVIKSGKQSTIQNSINKLKDAK